MSKLPQYIVNAVRRRAAAAEQWSRADDRITAYCEQLGLDTEYINKNIVSLFGYYDPDYFIRDLESAIDKKAQKE